MVDLHIKIPTDLHGRFKEASRKREVTMKDVVMDGIRRFVSDFEEEQKEAK
jgi:hypothetical protein